MLSSDSRRSVCLRVFIGPGFAPDHAAAVIATARKVPTSVARGGGPIYLCALTPEWGEVDVLIEDAFPVTPQIKGAFRSLPGVVEVEEF